MTGTSPTEMVTALGKGLLSFPVTTFRKDSLFDPRTYRDKIAWACASGLVGLFEAGAAWLLLKRPILLNANVMARRRTSTRRFERHTEQ